MRKVLVLTLAGAAVLAAGVSAPAMAACGTGDICTGTTTAAFTVVGGTIAITTTALAAGAPTGTGVAPSSVLSGGAATVTVPLGATTVLDTRLSSPGWTMSATAPETYALSGGTTETIPGTSSAFYVPLAPVADTASTGLGLGVSSFSSRQETPQAVNSTTRTTTLLVSDSTGPNVAVFTPTLQVTIPAGTASGLYTGTVTQSVS